MAIEVLLRKSVPSLGRVGDVVRVRPGYARNYLLPHGIAVDPSKENLRLVEKDKAVEAAEEAERAKQRAELLAKIAATAVTVEAKSNPEGHLFGSVGAKQVADALAAKGFPIEERHVRLEPVKQLGEYEVLVHLAEGSEAQVKLWVVDEVTKTVTKGPDGAKPSEGAKPTDGAKADKSAKAEASEGKSDKKAKKAK